jgi:hypothetical protein
LVDVRYVNGRIGTDLWLVGWLPGAVGWSAGVPDTEGMGMDAVATKKKPAKPNADEVVILSIKCRREWREWAMGIARAERASLATLIDQLLAERARERGLPDPPLRGKD